MLARDSASDISIVAPMSGWVWPLSTTPDDAFSTGLIGQGLAIDPMAGEVRAPFDGTVVVLNASRHAVVLRHAAGLELLIHVGIDTVALKGDGFEALVSVGDGVSAGDLLLRFDLDRVAHRAKSLVSPVVITHSNAYGVVFTHSEGEVQAGDLLMTLRCQGASKPEIGGEPFAGTISGQVKVGLRHGLHARPAAALSRLARQANITGHLAFDGRDAPLGSVVSLMSLGLQQGDVVDYVLTCQPGGEAPLLAFLQSPHEPASSAPRPPSGAKQLSTPTGDPDLIRGLCGAPGFAIGPAYVFRPARFAFGELASDPDLERRRLKAALDDAIGALNQGSPTEESRAVAEAHQALLDDTVLIELAHQAIASGKTAAWAWASAIQDFVARFQASNDARLRDRVSDLRDIEAQLLRRLCAPVDDRPAAPPVGAILVAQDLLPSQIQQIEPGRLAGLCLGGSGPTAHIAMIAGSLGLPLLTTAGPDIELISDQEMLILDADRGEVRRHPSPAALSAARAQSGARSTDAAVMSRHAQQPAVTLDGVRIEVCANLGGAAEAGPAVMLGADGCGLLRTEFMFMDRPTPPTEEEQRAQYQAVLDGLGGRALVIRTLDPAGDKPIAYLPDQGEANPALGLRGIRLSLLRPDLLQTQLRAILRLSPRHLVSIMIPMVTGPLELEAARAALQQAAKDLGCEADMALGLMIETPASVLGASKLARGADFFSIGTNDLSQYLLAMDRTNPQLARAADALHPSVLRAVSMTCDAAAGSACKVSVCGGLASDLTAIPLLIGLGVRRLSSTSAAIPRVKQAIRMLDIQECEALARQALDLDDAQQVRDLVEQYETGKLAARRNAHRSNEED